MFIIVLHFRMLLICDRYFLQCFLSFFDQALIIDYLISIKIDYLHQQADHLVVSLLAVVRLVASLVAGVGVLFVRPLLAIGVWCSRFLLRRRSSHEWSNDACLLKDEPQVSYPQDQVNKAKSLEEERVKTFKKISIETNRPKLDHRSSCYNSLQFLVPQETFLHLMMP